MYNPEGKNTQHGNKNITLKILLWSQSFCGVKDRQTDRGRRMETAVLTHKFFSWPYNAVLYSRLHLGLQFLGRRPIMCRSVGLCTATRWHSPQLTVSLLAASWDWLKTHTASFSRWHLNLSFHNTHTFRPTTWLLPLIFTVASRVKKLWLTARLRVNMQNNLVW